MLRMMTVQEICHFYASMRLPPHFSSLQKSQPKSQCAETVIDVLGMSVSPTLSSDRGRSFGSGRELSVGPQHIRDSKIGDEETRGVSGGQRKRVSCLLNTAPVWLTEYRGVGRCRLTGGVVRSGASG